MYINSTLYNTNIMEHCLTIIRVISPLSFSGQLALINWSTQWQKVSFAKGIVAFLGVTQWLKSPHINLNLSRCLKGSFVLFSFRLLHSPVLKVSKSQKCFFFEIPLPKKQTRYRTKFCPSVIGQNFI